MLTKPFCTRRIFCLICSSAPLDRRLSLHPIPLGEHYSEDVGRVSTERFPCDIYQCVKCSSVQIADDIDPEYLWAGYTYFSGQTQKILEHFEDFYDQIAKKVKSRFDTVFDIGSNDGSLLAVFKRQGSEVWGVDPAVEVADVARKNGIPTYVGLFDRATYQTFKATHRRASLITAFNVFAHSTELREMASLVCEMLDDEGVFAFEVQYLGDVVNRRILGTFFHEHMVHYSLHSATALIESAGMRIFDVQRNKIQMGSIIFFCCKEKSNYPNTTAVLELREAEESGHLLDGRWARSLSDWIEYSSARAKATLEEFRQAGKRISVYGAARSGPLLLIQLGLDSDIHAIYDDHPSKVGKYSGFNGLRVRPTRDIAVDGPDLLIIGAYLHSLPILKSLENYITAGGSILTVWPEVTLIKSKGDILQYSKIVENVFKN